ncbi:MAG: hypothetical protein HYR55_15470 [Acidobacteria bacterium]|nr:hypothetical protein [Acidobacteriota bacterium]MBI3658194.1 hypothetical protein [Acidobacteriota bacterium]
MKAYLPTILSFLIFSFSGYGQGTWLTFDCPGAIQTYLYDMPLSGPFEKFVGQVLYPPGERYPLIYDNAGCHPIGRNPAAFFAINGTNDKIIYTTESYQLVSGSKATEINYPSSFHTSVSGINDALQVIGTYRRFYSGAASHGFLYESGTYTTIDYPDAYTTELHGINNKQAIVGGYAINDPIFSCFIYESGQFTSLSYPGAQQTFCHRINDSGTILGSYSYTPGNYFLYNGKFTPLPRFPGSIDTVYTSINNDGQVGGFYTTLPDSKLHGFIYTP